ncbi:MAG TPA: hypothetical protein VN947_36630 [Polyangia bacterium]|nr:hypothetical protein [Polyangia bacterium]
MLRALAVALFCFAAIGCGDDTTAPATMDLSQPILDLSAPGHGQACGGTTCMGSCTVCVQLGGGLCAIPCNTAMPSTCPSGVCVALSTGGDGGVSGTFAGDCSAYDGACG